MAAEELVILQALAVQGVLVGRQPSIVITSLLTVWQGAHPDRQGLKKLAVLRLNKGKLLSSCSAVVVVVVAVDQCPSHGTVPAVARAMAMVLLEAQDLLLVAGVLPMAGRVDQLEAGPAFVAVDRLVDVVGECAVVAVQVVVVRPAMGEL